MLSLRDCFMPLLLRGSMCPHRALSHLRPRAGGSQSQVHATTRRHAGARWGGAGGGAAAGARQAARAGRAGCEGG
jgi:hypothetical protein